VLTSAADLVYIELGYPEGVEARTKQLFVTLDDDEQKVYDYLLKTGKELMDIIACVVNFLFIKYQECC
jgi:DNA processing protein